MGLDQYAYAGKRYPEKEVDFEPSDVGLGPDEQAEGLHYWRKHPDLHGWMERLYRSKGGTKKDFNTTTLALSSDDIDALEFAVLSRKLPKTSGFFFGESSDEDRDDDLDFIKKAREAIKAGKSVFYYSWW